MHTILASFPFCLSSRYAKKTSLLCSLHLALQTSPELLPCSFCSCKSDLFTNVNAPCVSHKTANRPSQLQIGPPSSQHTQPMPFILSRCPKVPTPLLLSILVTGAHILSTEPGLNTWRPELLRERIQGPETLWSLTVLSSNPSSRLIRCVTSGRFLASLSSFLT